MIADTLTVGPTTATDTHRQCVFAEISAAWCMWSSVPRVQQWRHHRALDILRGMGFLRVGFLRFLATAPV
jgi:hypothetical protein